jgi:hypothetical protein
MTESPTQLSFSDEPITQNLPAREWVKVRAATDGTQSYIVWKGAIYSWVPGEKRQHLFNMLGMSVARCIPNEEEGWDFTSRELTFYLDPKTSELLHQWVNPWTQATHSVMHVANSPVQGVFKGELPAQVARETTTYVFDLFPFYPNPLAADPTFSDYSPQPIYQSAEFFKMVVPTADLLNPATTTVTDMILSWQRIGPWLPWMKMGDRPGELIYSASGRKFLNFTDLPALLQNQIQTRVPLYRDAPETQLDQEDMTSWLNFQQHFQAYLAGEQFPIPQ